MCKPDQWVSPGPLVNTKNITVHVHIQVLYIDTAQADVDYLLGDLSQQQRSSALFILKLKEERRLTQVAVNDIVEGVEAVLEQSVIRAKAGVRAKLAAAGIDPGTITGLDEVFEDVTHPFCGLETRKIL